MNASICKGRSSLSQIDTAQHTKSLAVTVIVFLQDVEPGRPVRSQLASAAKSPEEAFRRMKNKTFVVETKFDGELSLARTFQYANTCMMNSDRVLAHCQV